MAIKDKLKMILNKKYFYEIMLAVDLVFSMLGWLYFSSIFLFISAIFALSILFISDDFKYALPFCAQFIFIFNGSYKNKVDVFLYACACAILGIGLIVYMIINKIKFKPLRMKWSFLILAIACTIPIIYDRVDSGYEQGYALFFQWWLYLAIYVVASNLIKKDMVNEVCKTYGTVGSLLALQCVYGGIILHQDWFYIGWGHANYANMLMILFVPLLVYLIVSEPKETKWIYVVELFVFILGCYSTHSRSFYLFFTLEAGLIYLYFVLKYKKYKLLIATIILGLCFVGLIMVVPKTRTKIISYLQFGNLTDFLSGRDVIWGHALDRFKESPLSIIFGHGAYTWLSGEFVPDGVPVIQLCHNTFFQTITMMGLIGIGAMGYHYFLKYKLFKGDKSLFGVLLLIGLIVNELYGLIDNTYHTFFFLITFIIIYVTYEKKRESEINTNLETNELTKEDE